MRKAYPIGGATPVEVGTIITDNDGAEWQLHGVSQVKDLLWVRGIGHEDSRKSYELDPASFGLVIKNEEDMRMPKWRMPKPQGVV